MVYIPELPYLDDDLSLERALIELAEAVAARKLEGVFTTSTYQPEHDAAAEADVEIDESSVPDAVEEMSDTLEG